MIEEGLRILANLLTVDRRQVDSEFESAYFHDWQTDPFSRGAYSYGKVGSRGAQHTLGSAVEGTLFFAGEGTDISGNNATVHGAIASANRAVAEILERFRLRLGHNKPVETRAKIRRYALFFWGTLAPFLRASDSPIAIACFRLFTTPPLPPLPDRSVPFFSRRTALSTFLPAAFPYLRLPDFFRELPLLFFAAIRSFQFNLCECTPRCKRIVLNESMRANLGCDGSRFRC